MTSGLTERDRAKADRQAAILHEAARLFAERGFSGVGRDLASLNDADRSRVRRLQREYVELWIRVLAHLHPDHADAELRVRAHACFGLINSTPHSMRSARQSPSDRAVRPVLESMAIAALTC